MGWLDDSFFLYICCMKGQVAADSAMEQIATALSEASLRKGETEQLKEDLAVNEKATQGRKGDIEQVFVGDARLQCCVWAARLPF